MLYRLVRFIFLVSAFSAFLLSVYWQGLNEPEKIQLTQNIKSVQQSDSFIASLSALLKNGAQEAKTTLTKKIKPSKALLPSKENRQSSAIKTDESTSDQIDNIVSLNDEYWQDSSLPKACQRTSSRKIEAVKTESVYRWKDKNGKTHFSDAKPLPETKNSDKTVFSTSQYQPKQRLFHLNIVDDQADMTLILASRIKSDVNAIYLLLSTALGFEQLREVDLSLRLFIHKNDFQRYKNKVAPGSKTNSGFYMASLNEASVVQWPRRPELTYSVIRHESSHLIMASLFGSTPRWFNEGLAEYFELLSTQGQSKRIAVDQRKLSYLEQMNDNNQLPSIEYLWSLKAKQFYQNSQLNYAMAWSVIHFMLSGSEEKNIFRRLIKMLYHHPCQPVDMLALVNTSYPGGMQAFELAYLASLNRQSLTDHYY